MTRKERKRLERDERRANVMMVIAILSFAIQLATFIITMTRRGQGSESSLALSL